MSKDLVANSLLVIKGKSSEVEAHNVMVRLFEDGYTEHYKSKDYQKHFVDYTKDEIKQIMFKVIKEVNINNQQKLPLEFDSLYNEMINKCNDMIKSSDQMHPQDQMKVFLTTSKIMDDKINFLDKMGLLQNIKETENYKEVSEVQKQLDEMNKIYLESKNNN